MPACLHGQYLETAAVVFTNTKTNLTSEGMKLF